MADLETVHATIDHTGITGIGGGSPLTVKDEGSNLDTAVTSLDFVGAGVTATNVGHAVTVTISGGGGGGGGATGGLNVYLFQNFR